MLSSTALTGGIAVLAVVDLGLALKPLDAPSLRGKERARFGFRGSGAGRRSSLCRSVCIACFVSLAVALVITHQELSGHREQGGTRDSVQPFTLVALLVFNVIMNALMLYNSCVGWRGAQRIKSNILLPVTGSSQAVPQGPLAGGALAPATAARGPPLSSTAPSQQLEKPLKTGDLFGKSLSIKVHAGGVKEADAPLSLSERHLDRRDSDLLLRGGAGRQSRHKAALPEMPGEDEELLDALMHDTIKVLVDC